MWWMYSLYPTKQNKRKRAHTYDNAIKRQNAHFTHPIRLKKMKCKIRKSTLYQHTLYSFNYTCSTYQFRYLNRVHSFFIFRSPIRTLQSHHLKRVKPKMLFVQALKQPLFYCKTISKINVKKLYSCYNKSLKYLR